MMMLSSVTETKFGNPTIKSRIAELLYIEEPVILPILPVGVFNKFIIIFTGGPYTLPAYRMS